MPESSKQNKRVQVGVIVGAHGIRGEVKIRSFTEEPQDMLTYGILTDETGSKVYNLKQQGKLSGGRTNQLIALLEGVTDRNVAELLKGTALYADAAVIPDLDEDTWYYNDLIGLQVKLADGSDFGKITAVHDFGAGDIVEIMLTNRETELFAFTSANFQAIDTKAKTIVITPPEVL